MKIAVMLGLFFVEILGLLGVAPEGFWILVLRMVLILGFLALLAWEIVRHIRIRGSQAPQPGRAGDENELAVLYHEIRNCTSTLRGNAHLLLQQIGSEKDRIPVERIKRAAASIERIAREVMVLADPGRLETKVDLDLPGLIKECADDLFPGSPSAFHLQCVGETLPKISGDPEKLRQAFVNIFRNSFEAEAGEIRIQIAPAGRFLRIRIEDDGMGCPPGDLKKIFLPMQTSKREKGGMGIGLALVKAIIEGHGGAIWASTRMGPRRRGLAMHITLPTAPCPFRESAAKISFPNSWRLEAATPRVLEGGEIGLN